MPKSEPDMQRQNDSERWDEVSVDLSALDPSRDEARWAGMVKQVAKRAIALRAVRRTPTVGSLLLAWSRPVLAGAAILVAVSWAIAGARARTAATTPAATPSTSNVPAALQVAAWASNDETPETTAMLSMMGGAP